MDKLNILIIDDAPAIREIFMDFCEDNDYSGFTASNPDDAFEILKKENIDIILLDIVLPGMNGIEVLKIVKKEYPLIEVIMISGSYNDSNIIQSMRLGALDFFIKPFRMLDVQSAIERTKKFIRLNSELKNIEMNFSLLSQELQDKIGFNIIGKSKAIKKVVELVSKVTDAEDTSVMIIGESGTGKELVARGIHFLSNRRRKYFFPVNCSAVSGTLFESEFFGHKKGSFTGATEDRVGWFEAAEGGTLFLDEIGDMPLELQTKLLRVLDDRKIKKVGSNLEIPIDTRIISATNRDLVDLVESKKFRLDLFHRLNTFNISIPPLRERKEDIPLLIDYFMQKYAEKLRKQIYEVHPDVYSALMDYPFTGNIRELKNMVERAVILADNEVLKLEFFGVAASNTVSAVKLRTADGEHTLLSESLDLAELEKKAVIMALKRTDNNKSQAAKLLNITWNSLDRRMKKYNLSAD